ncbi:MAG: proline racemase family protein, partial [Xanthomonadales bacterium]|nr:proline racemase family protein [Xanthomonadales bacterium]
QESICGGVFKASWQPGPRPEEVIPQLRARAWITAEATLLLDPADPFRFGLSDGA